jgi:hypothetical protein
MDWPLGLDGRADFLSGGIIARRALQQSRIFPANLVQRVASQFFKCWIDINNGRIGC